MGLRDALGVLVGSEPFGRLLLVGRQSVRCVARAGAGEDFVVAGVATALGPPCSPWRPGPVRPRRSPPTSRRSSAPNRCSTGMGGLALRGHLARPRDRRPARRHRRPHARGQGRVRARRAGARRDARGCPTLGVTPPLQLVAGLDLPPDALAERLVDLGYAQSDVVEHRGEFAVRGGVVDVFPGTARHGWRRQGDGVESIQGVRAVDQLCTERVALAEVPATQGWCSTTPCAMSRTRRGRRGAERFADQLERMADGLFVEGAESLAPFLFERMPTPGRARARGRVGRTAHPCASHDQPGEGRPPRGEALAEATAWPAARVLRARRRDRRSSAFTSPSSPRGSTSASSAGARRRATPPSSPRARELAGSGSASCCPVAATLARARRRGDRRRVPVEPVGSARRRIHVPGRRDAWPWSPRKTCSAHAAARAPRRGSRAGAPMRCSRARARRLRRPQDPRVGAVHGHHPPRACRRRA